MEKSAYEWLGLEPRLCLGEDEVREAFREAGKAAHPDAGGDASEFEKLRASRDILASPSKRLKHWLELRGTAVDVRGAVDAGLMDVFGLVGEVTQRASECVRKRGAAKSALGLALMENETQQCIELVEQAIARVDQSIASELGKFPAIESAEIADLETLAIVVRNLTFLEKWRASLRGLMPRLV